MIKSMTGFGKATVTRGARKIVVEIKSLNSKQLDLSLKVPALYREKELEMRAMIKEALDRGKIDMTLTVGNEGDDRAVAVNQAVVEAYFRQMRALADRLGVDINPGDLLQTVARFPEALAVQVEELDEEEWQAVRLGILDALGALNRFRASEGQALIADVLARVGTIERLAAEVPRFEAQRVPLVRQRLEERLRDWTDVKNLDENRLEQEIIYYLEKLDITEEKVRLGNHCRYFRETAEREEMPGRKLGFIAQEIGREINTMGSKANDHDIQKLVVRMKDELEKIKEQCLNIL